MPSQFFGLNIAASGLSAFQTSLNTTANNISNVQTQGYTRQTTNLESTDPMRVYSRYGSTGTGVAAVSITQERNLYYDTKYWQNNSSVGLFSQKLHYLGQIEEILKDEENTQEGFNSIMAKMFNSLDTLKTNGADESVRNQFIHEAQGLCTYFNALSISLKELQDDCNEEIKSTVSNINSMSEKIAMLNKEINMIEVRGGHANELRDQRAVLIDELSGIVSVETQEFEVHNSYGQNLGGTNYRVIINGQVLVDGNDYRTLECVSSKYSKNINDVEGMYEIVWADTKMDFASAASSSGGSLKALFAVRDGNNNENLTGEIAEAGEKDIQRRDESGNPLIKDAAGNIVADDGTVTGTPVMDSKKVIKITGPSITDLNALNIPAEGQITIGGRRYVYEGWEAEVGADGKVTSYTFIMADTEKVDNNLAGKTLSCGDKIDAMGVPYYQAQINEFVRNFIQLFNDIEKEGVTLENTPMGSFFVGKIVTEDDHEVVYDVDVYDRIKGEAYKDPDNKQPYTVSSTMDCYYKITAASVRVNEKSLKDPNYFSTATEITNGQDRQDISEKLLTLQEDVKMFRGGSAKSFLETLTSDITVDVNKTDIYANNYTNICNIIANQRMSVSGVDEDEEAVNLVKFQNAYNLASKMISVFSEIYNKLINETGVT